MTNLTTRLGQIAPLFANPNKIINGDMRIDQRNNGSAITGNGVYAADRFVLSESVLTTQAVTLRQSTAAPPSGFTNSLLFNVTGTGAAPATNTFVMFGQTLEGRNTSDLNWGTAAASPITLSFMALCTVAGTYCVSFRNYSGARSYLASYTLAANVWTYVILTIPGDTSGTWETDNTAGINLSFDCGSGSIYQSSAGSWQSGNYLALSSGTRLIATSGAAMYMTGLKLETGTIATPFIADDYSISLQKCLRYYRKYVGDPNGSNLFGSLGIGLAQNTTSLVLNIAFGAPMRTVPTLVSSNDFSATDLVSTSFAISSFVQVTHITDGAALQGITSGMTQGKPYFLSGTSTSFIAFDAEL